MRYGVKHKFFKQALIGLEKLKKGSGFTRFGFVGKEGEIFTLDGQPCYGSLGFVDPPFFYFFDYLYGGGSNYRPPYEGFETNRKENLKYLDWWANRSFWSDAILTKDPEFILNSGCVYATNFSAKRVICAAMVKRYVFENPRIVKWWILLEPTIGEDAAAVFSHVFYMKSAFEILLAPTTAFANGHTWISGHSFGKRELVNFLDREAVGDSKAPLRLNADYYGVNELFCLRYSNRRQESFEELELIDRNSKYFTTKMTKFSKNPIECFNFPLDELPNIAKFWMEKNTCLAEKSL